MTNWEIPPLQFLSTNSDEFLHPAYQPFNFSPLISQGQKMSKNGLKTSGEKKVKNMVKDMFSSTELNCHFTNHSLRTTRDLELFAAGVPEALIHKQTDHCSLESLRLYKTRGVRDDLNQTISNILAGESRSFAKKDQQISESSNKPKSIGNDSGLGNDLGVK